MKTVNVLVHPIGSSCNMSCGYCYRQHDSFGIMRGESRVMNISIFNTFFGEWNQMMTEGDMEVDLLWHGGEPLLAGLDFFKKATEITLTRSHKVNICIQSNGTLIDSRWISLFRDGGYSVGISLDGGQALHTKFRKSKNSKQTLKYFRKTVDTIQALLQAGVPTGVVITINRVNSVFADEVIDYIISLGVKKIQLSPCYEVHNPDVSVPLNNFATFVCRAYDKLLSLAECGVNIGYVGNVLDYLITGSNGNCIFGGLCDRFIILNWNGDIISCEGLRKKVKSFGRIPESRLSEILNSQNFSDHYQELKDSKDPECDQCEWAGLCKGGCPYYWQNGKTALCEANKIIFSHITRSVSSFYAK